MLVRTTTSAECSPLSPCPSAVRSGAASVGSAMLRLDGILRSQLSAISWPALGPASQSRVRIRCTADIPRGYADRADGPDRGGSLHAGETWSRNGRRDEGNSLRGRWHSGRLFPSLLLVARGRLPAMGKSAVSAPTVRSPSPFTEGSPVERVAARREPPAASRPARSQSAGTTTGQTAPSVTTTAR